MPKNALKGISSRQYIKCGGLGLYLTIFSSAQIKRFLPTPKKNSRPSMEAPNILFIGYWIYFPGEQGPRLEINHSLPSSAEVKNEWSYTSTPPTRLHGLDLDTLLFFIRQHFMYVFILQLLYNSTCFE